CWKREPEKEPGTRCLVRVPVGYLLLVAASACACGHGCGRPYGLAGQSQNSPHRSRTGTGATACHGPGFAGGRTCRYPVGKVSPGRGARQGEGAKVRPRPVAGRQMVDGLEGRGQGLSVFAAAGAVGSEGG